MADVDQILAAISADDPCGPSLAADFAYFNLLEEAKGKPERQMGTEVKPAEDPNWQTVRSTCTELLGRSKDLWLASLLSLAELQLQGWEGFRSGLACVAGLIDRHWEGVHPRLDPDDGDASERLSALSPLASPAGSFGDTWRFVERIRACPLTDSRQLGRFGLRDILAATGEAALPDGFVPPTPDLIEAAFEDTATEPLRTSSVAIGGALEHLAAIRRTIGGRLGAAHSPEFEPVEAVLRQAKREVDARLARRGGGGGVAAEAGGAGGSLEGSGAATEIRSPADVHLLLDRIIGYYVRHEPSSPVPLLLRRAQKLISRNFMDIIRDLSPSSLDQIRLISGEREEGGA